MNKKSLYFAIYLLFIALPSSADSVSTSLTLTNCVGGYCSNQTSDSPMAGTGNKDLDEARYEAYRYELRQKYKQAVNRLKNQTEKWVERRKEIENLSIPQFNQELELALAELEAKIPDLPNDLPSLEERRAENPYPTVGNAKEFLDRKLDNIWDSIKDQSPQNVAKKIDKIQRGLLPNQDTPTSIKNVLDERREFLNKELLMSKVINGNGLINAPFVEPFGLSLKSNPNTQAGFDTRSLMNKHIANQSVVESKCRAGQASASDCAVMKDYKGLIDLNLLALDRWASVFRFGNEESSPQFNSQLKILEEEVAFANGFIQGGADAIEGIKALLNDPVGSVQALTSAIYNYDKTYDVLKQSISETWEDYQQGDSVQRAEILGKLSFEIATALVPASKIGVIQKISATSKAANKALVKLSKPILEAKVFGGAATREKALALAHMVRNNFKPDGLGQKIENVIDESKDYFQRWRGHYVHVKTETGLDNNIRIRRINPDYSDSYKPNSKVFLFETNKTEPFVRVHHANNQNRPWIMRKEDIIGLTPLEIQKKYALSYPPTYISTVNVPKNTQIRRGRINAIGPDDINGAIQYELTKKLPVDFFGEPVPINGVIQ